MRRFQTGNRFEWGTTGISIETNFILNICISDLDDDIKSKVLTFADDTTVFRNISCDVDRQQL